MSGISREDLTELAYAVSNGETLSSTMTQFARRVDEDEQHCQELNESLKTLDLIRRALRSERARDGKPSGVCLDDEMLSAYIDGALNSTTRHAAEVHFSQCSTCLDQLASLAELVRVIQPADESCTTLRYVVEVARRGLRLVLHPENDFSLLTPTPAAVLSSGEASQSEFQQCCSWRQQVGESTVSISIMQTGDERVDISLAVTFGVIPVPKARITLRRDGHIVQSESTSDAGRVSLHNLEIGIYECEMKLPDRDSKDNFTLDLRREES